MKISRLFIKNYRNIKHIDIQLSDVVAVIGENNSGKSNLLRALTLPFLADDAGYMGKTLSWIDINNEEKQKYYDYLLETPLYNFFIKKISYRNFLMYNELTTKHFTKER